MEIPTFYIRVAVAGSGKTHSLVERARELISDERGDDGQVVVTTHTREAASVLRSRIIHGIGGDKIGRRLMVGTIHSLATQVTNSIRSAKGLPPLRVVGDGRSAYRLLEAIQDVITAYPDAYERLAGSGLPTDAEVLARRMVVLREVLPAGVRVTANDLFPYVANEAAADFAALAMSRWAELTREAPIADMARIVPAAIEALRDSDDARRIWRPRHVLVDETSDLSPIQIEFLDTMSCMAESIYMVGDPDQSIYGWRGGGALKLQDIPSQFIASSHLARNTVVLPPLTRSRRCPDVVGAAVNALLNNTTNGPSAALIGHDGGSIETSLFMDEGEEARAVAAAIGALPVGAYREIAVLGRTHAAVEASFFALVREQIPVRLMKADDPVLRHCLDRISVWMRLALTPQDMEAAKMGLRMRAETKGLGVASLRKVEAKLRGGGSAYDILANITPAPGLRKPQVEAVHEVARLMKDVAVALRRAGHIADWIDWLARYAPAVIAAPDNDREDVLRALSFAHRLALATSSPQRFIDVIRDGTSDVGVSVGTFHASKGREWSSVILVGMTAANIEGFRRDEKFFKPGVMGGTMDELYRLIYVASTRARSQLVISAHGSVDEVSRVVGEMGLPIGRPSIPPLVAAPEMHTGKSRRQQPPSMQLQLF